MTKGRHLVTRRNMRWQIWAHHHLDALKQMAWRRETTRACQCDRSLWPELKLNRPEAKDSTARKWNHRRHCHHQRAAPGGRAYLECLYDETAEHHLNCERHGDLQQRQHMRGQKSRQRIQGDQGQKISSSTSEVDFVGSDGDRNAAKVGTESWLLEERNRRWGENPQAMVR